MALWILLGAILAIGVSAKETAQAEAPVAAAAAPEAVAGAETRVNDNWRLRDRIAENQWRLEHRGPYDHEDPHIRELIRPKGHELLREHERHNEHRHREHDLRRGREHELLREKERELRRDREHELLREKEHELRRERERDLHRGREHESQRDGNRNLYRELELELSREREHDHHERGPHELPRRLPPVHTEHHIPNAKERAVISEVISPLYRQPQTILDYRFLSSGGRDYGFSETGQTLILPRGVKNPEHQEFENYDIYIEYLRLKGLADERLHKHEPGKVRIERIGFEAIPRAHAHRHPSWSRH